MLENNSNIIAEIPSFEEVRKAYESVVTRNGTFEDLQRKLGRYKNVPAMVNYFYANYYHREKKEYNRASEYISKSIAMLENDDDYSTFSYKRFLDEIYGLAGEIYAYNNQPNESLYAFQDYMLCLSRLKGISGENSFLSFRKYNEYSISDLINNELIVCSPREVNDPFDTLLLNWGECLRQTDDRPHTEYLCQAFESYRIRSFTQLFDQHGNEMVQNVLMWSHYAESHTGFCVKYKFSEEFLSSTTKRSTIRFHKITYQKDDNPLNLLSSSITALMALSTKQHNWEYENEVRLVAYEPDVHGHFHALPLDSESHVECIYFGCKCSDKRIETIKKILSNQSDIKFYKMKSNPNDIYHLTYDEII